MCRGGGDETLALFNEYGHIRHTDRRESLS